MTSGGQNKNADLSIGPILTLASCHEAASLQFVLRDFS